MFCFKFQQNCTMNEEFYFCERGKGGGGGCRGTPIGLVPTKDMQILPPPLLLRSGHLDIKYVHCAENKDGRKISYHIISRLGAAGVLTFGHPKMQLSSKVAKYAR